MQGPLPEAARPHIDRVLDALLVLVAWARDPAGQPLVTLREPVLENSVCSRAHTARHGGFSEADKPYGDDQVMSVKGSQCSPLQMEVARVVSHLSEYSLALRERICRQSSQLQEAKNARI